MKYPIAVAMLYLCFAAIFAALAVLFRDDILAIVLASAVSAVFLMFAVIVIAVNFGKASRR